MISCVPYHLRRLVIYVEDSPMATMGLNQLWVPSTISKYCMLMTRLLITMVRSKESNLVDDKPFVNVFGNLHLDFTNALENFISYIQHQQNANKNDEDFVHIHTVLLHICRLPTCPVISHELQTSCPIMRFLIMNNLKLNLSSINIAFEHVWHVKVPITIL